MINIGLIGVKCVLSLAQLHCTDEYVCVGVIVWKCVKM